MSFLFDSGPGWSLELGVAVSGWNQVGPKPGPRECLSIYFDFRKAAEEKVTALHTDRCVNLRRTDPFRFHCGERPWFGQMFQKIH